MDKNINKLIVPLVVAAVVFGGVGFFSGMQFQKSQTPSGARNFAGGNFSGASGQSGSAARRTGMNGASGQIIAKDAQSITVKITNGTSTGSSKIVLYSPSTSIFKQASGTADDLSVGSTVMVTGTANSDGSITAQSISLRPATAGSPNPGGTPTGAPGSGNPQTPAPTGNTPNTPQ